MRDRLCVGDGVRIKSGPMADRRGTVESINFEEEVVKVRQELGDATVST